MNLFDVNVPDPRAHFLCILILGYLLANSTLKDRDGFVSTNAVVEETQKWGFVPIQTQTALRRMTNKRLIETVERITFEEDLIDLIGELPDGFRQTSIGAYHLKRWVGKFAYLDAMVFDTPIFDQAVRDKMLPKIGSFNIADRYERTLTFRSYLSAAWEAANLRPEYFDWRDAVREGQGDFNLVAAAIRKNAVERDVTRQGGRGR
jgi:hypothetical protein